jgi:hypothetical protein
MKGMMSIEIICPGCKRLIDCPLPIPLEYGDGKNYTCRECEAHLFRFRVDDDDEET